MRGRWKTDRTHFAEDEVYYEDDGEYPDDNTAYGDDGNPIDYDGDELYWQDEEWDDVQSTYYGSTVEDMPANDEVFDTEEFDRVYAAYADSKRQLNQLRVSRGFFPVVAVAGGQQLLLLPPQPLEVNRLQGLVQKGSQRVSQKAKRDQKVQRD